ncbi:hypothetical protein [Massilibacterium senegalense]|uniref:hypothetical protein n=1 Tax=Massilibacterium senegalense TaxID=1632858 RepID=UPI0007855708|nr:hypothetical protein [Massilibacterium senegalense]
MLKSNIEKVLGILLIILLAFNLFFLLYIHYSTNKKQDQLEEKLAALSSEVNNLIVSNSTTGNGNAEKTIDFLKQEYTNYKDFANNDRESFMNLVSLFFVALGVLVTGGIIVLYWIFGQTKTEVKENANTTIKHSINEIGEQANTTIKNFVKEIEEETKNKIKSLIDPTIEGFEVKYNELERFIESQHSIRNSRVVVLTPENKKEEMESIEVARIRGIVGEAQIIGLDEFEEFEKKINNKEIDIIIYRYELDGKEQEGIIQQYIGKLKELDLSIPIVVYATFDNRIVGEDANLINSYPYAVLANMPTSLTSNMVSLANVVSYERR